MNECVESNYIETIADNMDIDRDKFKEVYIKNRTCAIFRPNTDVFETILPSNKPVTLRNNIT